MPLSLGTPELRILHVDVVHNLPDSREPRIPFKAGSRQEDLERAPIAFVRELGLEDVEPEFARLGDVAFGRLEP